VGCCRIKLGNVFNPVCGLLLNSEMFSGKRSPPYLSIRTFLSVFQPISLVIEDKSPMCLALKGRMLFQTCVAKIAPLVE